MGERDDFLDWVNTRMRDAEIALHDGDAAPRRETWTRAEPVSVFGAWKVAVGLPEVDVLFSLLAERFGGSLSYEFELVAADVVGNMAYTAGFEHIRCLTDGEPREYTLRVTHVFRREDGQWRVVHRHGDTFDPHREL